MLDAFFQEGWNARDLDRLMSFMAEDCVFESSGGPDVCGTRYQGRDRVREGFARVFAAVPNARFGDTQHVVAGDPGGVRVDLHRQSRRPPWRPASASS